MSKLDVIVEQARTLREAFDAEFGARPGVVGTAIGLMSDAPGEQRVGFIILAEPDDCSDVAARVPAEFSGVPIRVMAFEAKIGFRGAGVQDAEVPQPLTADPDRKFYDPTEAGCNISSATTPDFPLTLGPLVYDFSARTEASLTAAHASPKDNDTIYQPAPVFTRPYTFKLGEIYRRRMQEDPGVDVAWIKYTPNDKGVKRAAAPEVIDNMPMNGIGRAPALGSTVRKRGFMSRVTSGTVHLTDASYRAEMEGRIYIYKKMFAIVEAAAFGQGGDSGSPVINQRNQLIGTLVGGAVINRRACAMVMPIDNLFGADGVDLNVGGYWGVRAGIKQEFLAPIAPSVVGDANFMWMAYRVLNGGDIWLATAPAGGAWGKAHINITSRGCQTSYWMPSMAKFPNVNDLYIGGLTDTDRSHNSVTISRYDLDSQTGTFVNLKNLYFGSSDHRPSLCAYRFEGLGRRLLVMFRDDDASKKIWWTEYSPANGGIDRKDAWTQPAAVLDTTSGITADEAPECTVFNGKLIIAYRRNRRLFIQTATLPLSQGSWKKSVDTGLDSDCMPVIVSDSHFVHVIFMQANVMRMRSMNIKGTWFTSTVPSRIGFDRQYFPTVSLQPRDSANGQCSWFWLSALNGKKQLVQARMPAMYSA